MTFAEAAMIMMSGDGDGSGEVQKFELPEKVEITQQESTTAYKRYIIMETYTDSQRKIILSSYKNKSNSSYYNESVSNLNFFDDVNSNTSNHSISFYGFYID